MQRLRCIKIACEEKIEHSSALARHVPDHGLSPYQCPQGLDWDYMYDWFSYPATVICLYCGKCVACDRGPKYLERHMGRHHRPTRCPIGFGEQDSIRHLQAYHKGKNGKWLRMAFMKFRLRYAETQLQELDICWTCPVAGEESNTQNLTLTGDRLDIERAEE